ncbi:hypothetical protein ACTFIY_000168 [Dictyostelium cf. discoideum]
MDEERKKRLEDLKQQSLELEKEAQEREKRNEERKKAREEQQRLAAEQEKKDEEERLKKQKEREERRKKREEDEKILKEEMEKLESDKANRITSPKTPTSGGSNIALSPSTSSYSISENSGGGGDSSTSLLSAQAISAKEEREKRRKELEEEAKKLELEQQKIREEREKRKEERRLQQEEEQRKLQDLLDKKDSEKIEKLKQEENEKLEKELFDKKEKEEKELAEKLEKERQEKELAEKLEKERQEKELADKLEKEKKEAQEAEEKERLDKEKKDKEEKELADKLEKESQEKELAHKLEKERQEKELADKLEKESQEKELADKLEKERQEKELADKLEKEKKEAQEKERQDKELADKLAKEQKEKEEKELADKLEKEKQEKECQEKELADKLEKEKQEKELADKLEKEKEEKELSEKLEKEKQEKELADKLAKEQKEKEEKEKQEKEEKERKDKELAETEKLEKERIEKEKKELEEKELAEKLEKEKIEKELADKLEKEKKEKELADKLEKEKQDKELADKLEKEQKEKEEKQRKEKELADKLEKEKQDKELADKIAKEKEEKENEEKQRKDKELADKVAKEKEEKDKKEKEFKLKLEKEQKEKELKLKQEREFAEKEERDRLEREKISKSVEKETKSSSITDQFKLSIEKQLQSQLENKKKPVQVTEDNSSSSSNNNDGSTSTLTSLTKDRVKMKGRQAPSKSHKAPGSTSTSNGNDDDDDDDVGGDQPSLLSKALENNKNNNESSPTTKKKIVLPPGAVGGIMGSMASLAMEAQKKKMEIENNKLLSNVLKDEPAAPNFVRGRSQSVSVTSTLKQDPNKFLNHKKSIDTYSGLRARLVHCKGKKRILTKEVEISINSLNKMDAFVLDCGIENSNVGGESVDSNSHSTIFTWYGSKSTANKKAKAVAIAEIIKSHERGGHATIIKLDEGDENELFYKRIGGGSSHKSTINPDGGDDLEAELNWASSFTLLKYLTDKDQLIHVDTKSLSMELLESDGFYVLDTVSEFYEWSGRNSDQSLKEQFHKKCQERLKNNQHRQSWVESVVLSEGGETVLFREKFFDWPDLSHEVSLQRMGFGKKRVFDVSIPYEKKSPAKMNQFQVREMVEIERAEEVLKSDGSGEYEIWYIENCKSYPLPKEEYGHFFSGCCYLIRYTYTKWNALKYAIYYWQGADASRQDVGSSSLLSKDLYIETSARGECSQDPERQGRETNHFNMIFNGKMVVHKGDRNTYQFNNNTTRMYHVFGKKSNTITASQTSKLSSTCLNSRDCFIITNCSTSQTFIWESKGSNKQLKEESSKLASLSNSISKSKTNNPIVKVIKEGSEPDEFWKLIGGNGKYANFDYVYQNVPTDWENQIKLFAIVNTGTIIRADEIYRFSQYDLTPSKVYLLDNRKNVFVWSGLRAQEKEKKRGMEIAIDYVKYLADSRTENDVLFITQGDEPLSFTCYFHCWDSLRLNNNNNNNNNSNGSSNNTADSADELDDGASPKNAVNLLKKYYQVLPFEKLIEKNTPPEIDRSVLEMYLSDEDFEKHLGSRAEWDALPAWKKTEKKKVSGLF